MNVDGIPPLTPSPDKGRAGEGFAADDEPEAV
jgi:hypothetical protein